MIPVALVTAALRLATRVLELVPEPDPELRAARQRHRQELARLRLEARLERRRRG